MALIKKPYEISVWQDIIMYVGTPVSGEGTISTKNINDLSSVDYQYYDEQRLATIGSHTMTSPMRAINPTLTRNINGVETLKFEMYYQYIDPNTGEREHNPLIDYLVNERKIKLYYEDEDPNHPDYWYDFVIKKDEEKARDNKYSFTCNSLGAAELGKTGFKVELNIELENNMGTVQELAGKVLENSDWQLSETQDIIKQTVNEPLYKIYLNQSIEAFCTQDGESGGTISIPANEIIYVYYTSYANKEKDYFQFIYIADESQIKLQSDRMTLICDDEYIYDLFLNNVIWNENKPNFQNGEESVANYRGDRYVRKQLTAYDSTLKKTVKIYQDNSEPPKEVYGYQTTKYYGVNAVINYIHNSVNFGGASYWYGFGDGTSIERIIYPPASAGVEDRISYLSMKIGAPIHVDPQDSESQIDYTNSPRIMNDGIIYNYSKIKTFDKNDTYLLRMKVRKMNANGTLGSYLTNSNNFPFTCQVRKYEKIDQNTGTRCFNFLGSNASPDPDDNNYALIEAKCETSASIEELKNNIGIFFFRSEVYGNKRQNEDGYDDLAEGESYYVEEVQLTQGIWAEATDTEPAHWIKIGEVPTVKSAIINHFYYPEENVGLTNPDDYVYISEDPDDDQHPVVFTPLYSEGANQFEKIRSISAKESNRFNLLQQLCETFECWVKFHIDHEQNGRIKVVDYNYYQPLNQSFRGGKITSKDEIEQGNINSSGINVNSSTRIRTKGYIEVSPNTSYKINFNTELSGCYLFYYQEDYTYINSTGNWKNNNFIFTTANNTYYIRVIFRKTGNAAVTPNDFDFVQVFPWYNIDGQNNYYIYNYFDKEYQQCLDWKPNRIYYFKETRKRQDKEVIFYGEILEDNPLGFKYGINLKDVTRTLDSEQIATKIIVKNNSNEYADNGFCSIARAKDNPTKENFLYNFDYYIKQGILNESILNNDLYLRDNTGSIGLYPNLADYNSQRNQIITDYANLANEITEIKADVETSTLEYNSASEELYKLTDPVSGKLVRYTGYIYEDFYDQVARAYKEDNANHIVPAYGDQIYYAPDGVQNLTITAYNNSNTELSGISYYKKIIFPAAIKGSDLKNTAPYSSDITNDGHFNGWNALKYYIRNGNYERCKKDDVVQDDKYYIYLGESNKTPFYIKGSTNTFVQATTYLAANDGTTYYWYYSTPESIPVDTPENIAIYFQTPANTTKLGLVKTNNTTPTTYIYGAYRRVGAASDDDTVNDTSTINYLEQITTLKKTKADAEVTMEEKKALLEEYQAQYDEYTDQLKDIAKATEEIELQFITKYSRYIQEGSWHDDNYMDDDLYYLDAVQVLYQSAYPKVSYNISVLELSALEGYEPYKFGLAHRTFIEDTEFFGWDNKALNIPARERIVVTELANSLDQPEKNTIKVQNYKNHFEDLFQRITAATQNLEYHSGDYKRAADAITTDGVVDQTIMQKTMAAAQFVIQNAENQSVVIDNTGLLATKLDDPGQRVLLTSGGLLVSTDGGEHYGVAITGYGINADYLRAGIIDAEKVNILAGSYPTFRWDAHGIRAYAYTEQDGAITSYNASNYVTLDRFGLYGINGITSFVPNKVTDVEKKANFALTWNGLFIRSNYRRGYVSISPNDDIALYSYGSQGFSSIGPANALDELYYLDNRNAFYYVDNDEYIKCTTESLANLGNEILYISGYQPVQSQSPASNYYYLYGGEFIKCSYNEDDPNSIPDPEILTNRKFYQIFNGTPGATAVKRGKFGMIGVDGNNNELYGLALYNEVGDPTVITQSDGTLWLQDAMRIGDESNQNGQPRIYLGRGEDVENNLWKVMRVYNTTDQADRFVLYSDGSLYASSVTIDGDSTFTGTVYANSGSFTGAIYATSGKIGNMTIASLPNTIGVRISPNTAEFKYDGSDATPSSVTFTVTQSFDGTVTYQWYKGITPDSMIVISGQTSDSYTYNFNYSDFGSGVSYLKVVVTVTNNGESNSYEDRITLSYVMDGQKGEDAGQYQIQSSQQRFLRYLSANANEEQLLYEISPGTLKFSLKNLETDTLQIFTENEMDIKLINSFLTEEQKFKSEYSIKTVLGNPNNAYWEYQGYIQCQQNSEYDQNTFYYIKDSNNNYIRAIIDEQTFNANKTNYYYLDTIIINENNEIGDITACLLKIDALYNYSQQEVDNASDDVKGLHDALYAFFNQLQGNICISIGNSTYKAEKYFAIQNGLTDEMMEFQVNARNIQAAIDNKKLTFGDDGLIIDNGGFTIRQVNDQGIYDPIFYIEPEQKQIWMQGSGTFTGKITANEGQIGGFSIGAHSITSNDLILQSEYKDENNQKIESRLTIKNIDIGTGANIQDYLQIGNLKLLNPSVQANDNYVMKLEDNGVTKFSLTNDGNGYFNGTINATDGSFSGEIVASVINASTINTANFVSEETRTMGGSFIYKPAFEVIKIEEGGSGSTIKTKKIKITLTSNAKKYAISSESGKDRIISLSGNGIRYGKLVDDNNWTEDTIHEEFTIYGEFTTDDHDIILDQTEIYNTITFYGYGNDTSLLIGINSDNDRAGNIMPPRALVMESFSNLNIPETNGGGTITYNTKLLLGDLSSIESIVGEDAGYGLYADNVYLKGSLTTTSTNNNNYAGVNTRGPIDFNYGLWNDGNSDTSEYSDHKIIFWGGASGITNNNIQSSKFIVTDKGSIFATSGEFKGSVISDSVISKSVIQAAIIEGTGTNSPSLKIYDTGPINADGKLISGGIGFYQKVVNIDDNDNNENNDILTLSIDTTGLTYLTDKKFIEFNTNEVIATLGRANFDKLQINDQGINSNDENIKIRLNDNDRITINANGITNTGNYITNEGTIIFTSNNKTLKYMVKEGYYVLYVEEVNTQS